MKVAYLGPEGSYSHLATLKMKPEAELIPCNNFTQVFKTLNLGEADGAIVPIENSLNGGVMQVLDLLNAFELIAVDIDTVQVDHRLFTFDGTKPEEIKRIYSHGQALEQCARTLAEKYPNASTCAVASTTAGFEMLKTKNDACIAGAHIERQGLVRSDKNLADEQNNYTQFLYLVRGAANGDMKSKKVFFSFTCQNEPGALLSVLSALSKHGINITELQSRPIKNTRDEYCFFVECEGDYSSPKFKKAFAKMKNAAGGVKVLGCY